MYEPQYQGKELSVGDDGELTSEIFCTACGTVNDPSAGYCVSCHAVLAEQGNHLSARLRRISRRASAAKQYFDEDDSLIADIPTEVVNSLATVLSTVRWNIH